jgi:CheY-like chemotaxis protein
VAHRVLDIGQCNADHGRISEILDQNFDVIIDRAHCYDEALKMALDTPFDLILINRIMDADGTPGMDILNALKSQPSTVEVPVIIVSNYDETQNDAVASGAVRGFGKSELDASETMKTLSKFLDA